MHFKLSAAPISATGLGGCGGLQVYQGKTVQSDFISKSQRYRQWCFSKFGMFMNHLRSSYNAASDSVGQERGLVLRCCFSYKFSEQAGPSGGPYFELQDLESHGFHSTDNSEPTT